jgi:hypothetical protein
METPDGVWIVQYSTAKDLDKGRDKAYDGKIHFWSVKDWIVLLDARGVPIAGRISNADDVLQIGSSVAFPSHLAMIRECRSSPKVRDSPAVDIDASSMAAHASLAMGLDFTPGSQFKANVRHHFRSTVHPLGKSDHFLMAVSFGRAKFKLDVDTVSLALESCLGGSSEDLTVVHLRERVFHFSLASKQVGFLVSSVKSFSCSAFKCYFHLWGNGGPHWRSEFRSWQMQCNEEWTLVSPNKKRTDRAMAALKNRPSSSILRQKGALKSVSKRLSFATFQSYDACLGYECPVSLEDAKIALQAGYDCPQIRRKAGVIFPATIELVNCPLQFGSIQISDNDQNSHHLAPDSVSNAKSSDTETSLAHEPSSDDSFAALIDDMAFQFWRCSRCLSMAHDRPACTNKVWCRSCFHYGHVKKNCFAAKNRQTWVAKKGKSGHSSLDCSDCTPQTKPAISSPESPTKPICQPPPLSILPPKPAMANFEIDPARWVPLGQQIVDGGPTRLPRTFYTPAVAPAVRHGSFCVAVIEPPPPAADEPIWRDHVRDFIVQHH